MKKALVLALSVFMVLALATAAFAAEVSYSGKVQVKWAGETDVEPGFAAGDLEAGVTIDFTKDYGDGVTAGVTTKIQAHGDSVKEFDFDGAGWIKLDYDILAVTAKTEIDGNAANDLAAEWGLAGAPGVQVDVTAIDGLAITGLINAGPTYNFLTKAEYSADALALGAGFQKHGLADDAYIEAELDEEGEVVFKNTVKDAFAIWGSYEVIDGLTIAGEFASRTENYKIKKEDEDRFKKPEAMNAILVKASYEGGGLTVDAAFLNQDLGFVTQNEDDADDFLARDFMKLGGFEGNVLYVDASYALTDALKVSGAFDYVLSAKVGKADVLKNFKDLFDEDFALSYKVAADYDLTEEIALGAWYKGYGYASEFGGKAVYTFAEGVTGTLEVTNGKGHKVIDEDAGELVEPKAVTKYSFVLSAEF
ncbi:hypothetical protein [Capillibacterium thermochitinicola]|uniref:Porin n=1 Tax=Capillibacterium thermochitinicola TaxID=2699427 RepID=A0A8J6I3X6_9FIRM|nr:hypothetical protein [Capillibacterium thermochitinicola]MBA2133777.1 hypothetical protein [Capillibacterium thermochitinicola]